MCPQPADLRLVTRWTDGHEIVAVAGAIDICTAPAVRAYLLDTIGAIPGNGGQGSDLVLDLSAVTFMDARGLSTLIWADHSARRAGRHLRLAAPTVRITRLLAITHLDLYFDLHLTSEAASHARPG